MRPLQGINRRPTQRFEDVPQISQTVSSIFICYSPKYSIFHSVSSDSRFPKGDAEGQVTEGCLRSVTFWYIFFCDGKIAI